jgi:hypothetical protein
MLHLKTIICTIAVAGTLALSGGRVQAQPVVAGDFGRFYRVYYRTAPTPDWFFHDRFVLLADARVDAANLQARGLATRIVWDGDSGALTWFRRWGRHRRPGVLAGSAKAFSTTKSVTKGSGPSVAKFSTTGPGAGAAKGGGAKGAKK